MRPSLFVIALVTNFFAISGPISAQDVDVTFYCEAGKSAGAVYLAGPFNGWSPADEAYRMLDVDGDGVFTAGASLTPGEISYKYVIDGTWTRDPWNPRSDGSQYDNSRILIADPMVTYLLPVDGGAVDSVTVQVIVAGTDGAVNADSIDLFFNGNAVPAGSCTYGTETRMLTYVPADSELVDGANRCSVSVRSGTSSASAVSGFTYTGNGVWYTVSGAVTEEGGGPLSGIAVAYGDGDTVFTDGTGAYSFMLPDRSNATVRPVDAGYTFSPEEQVISELSRDMPDVDFSASSGGSGSYSVSGEVADAGGAPVENVRVEWLETGADFMTRQDGAYSFPGVAAGNPVTLVPSLSGHYFIPETLRIASVNADYTGQDFICVQDGIVLDTVSVSGTVLNGGTGVAGVALAYGTDTAYTDASGNYSLDVFNSGLVTLVPQSTGFTFLPAYRQFMNLADDTAGVDFSAVPDSDAITGRVVFAGSDTGFVGLTVNLDYARGGGVSTVTDARGAYLFMTSVDDMAETYLVSVDAPEGFTVDPEQIMINPEEHTRYHDNDFTVAFTLVADTTGDSTGGSHELRAALTAGVDTNGHIAVDWQGPVTDFIREYRISRESAQAGVYTPMDSIPYGSDETWTDTTANPAVQAYTYRLTAVTIYGQESIIGTHRTVHLTINKGVGDAWNLIWTPYLGKVVSTYKLYCGVSADSVVFLADIAGNLTSYTDLTPSVGTAYYQIEAVFADDGSGDGPDTLMVLGRAAGTAGAAVSYLSARSNVVNSASVGIADEAMTHDVVTGVPVLMRTGTPMTFAGAGGIVVSITDVRGGEVVRLVGRDRIAWDGGIEAGVYTVLVTDGHNEVLQKMIVVP